MARSEFDDAATVYRMLHIRVVRLSLMAALVLSAGVGSGCTGSGPPTAAPTSATATVATTTPVGAATPTEATRTPVSPPPGATRTPVSRPVGVGTPTVRHVRAPKHSAREVSRAVWMAPNQGRTIIVERDAIRGKYSVRAACAAGSADRTLSLRLLDARPRSMTAGAVDPTMASVTVPCSGRVLTAGFGGFGYGGPVELDLGDLTGVSSAYAVLVPAPR